MKKPNFSKSIIVISIILFFIVIFSGILASFRSLDTSFYVYAIPSSAAVLGTSVVFYYKKAQIENALYIWLNLITELTKLKKQYEPDECVDIVNQAINMTQDKIMCAVQDYANEAMQPVEFQNNIY